ncbi:MAG: hypothetical protein PHR96_00095 [Clostridia bacterium]|nr:hypothetical protein [Clostridia bacterium]
MSKVYLLLAFFLTSSERTYSILNRTKANTATKRLDFKRTLKIKPKILS